MKWTKKELDVLNQSITTYGVVEGSRVASMKLPRTSASCMAKYYYKKSTNQKLKTEFHKFQFKNGQAFAIFKIKE
jgi:hypothetical protein